MKMMVKKPGAGGKGGPVEIPDDDNHRAAIVAVVDLGTHTEAFPGSPPKDTRKVAVCYEILDSQKADGSPFLMAETYTASLHEKAKLRAVVEAACGKLAEGVEFDFAALLGKIVKLTVTHQDNGKSGDDLRKYARLEGVGLADKKDRGQKAKTQETPFQSWFADGTPYAPCDWMPWVFHHPAKARMALEEVIAQSKERAGKAPQGPQAARQEQPKGGTPSDGGEDTPF